jgi:nucleoside-diphosphate-sugar epimerase
MSNVIGDGMLARSVQRLWQPGDQYRVFASGVSNSKCINSEDFKRETLLLANEISKLDKRETLIYFSSCSVEDKTQLDKSMYLQHKLFMENLVKRCNKYQIFRLPQVVGDNKGKKTIIAFFYESIINGEKLLIEKGSLRNFIDVDHVVKFCKAATESGMYANSTHNISNPASVKVEQILKVIEEVTGFTADVEFIQGRETYSPKSEIVKTFSKRLDILFDNEYLKRLITKYYGQL